MAKSSKTARNDRQAVVEQMRHQQKKADRRQGLVIVVVCVVVGLLIIGAAAFPVIKEKLAQRAYSGKPLEQIGSPASACQQVTSKSATGNQQHVAEGTPINYPDAPPAFGEHYYTPDPMGRKFYTKGDRPAVGTLVHNLEHGYNVVWYDQTVAQDSTQMAELRAIAAKQAGTTNLRDKFKAVPWLTSDGKAFPGGAHIAFTHWSVGGTTAKSDGSGQLGIWQYCSSVSGAALSKFMIDYPYTDSPEPGSM